MFIEKEGALLKRSERPIKKIRQEITDMFFTLVLVMTLLLTAVSIYENIRAETARLDENLQNMAEAIAESRLISDALTDNNTDEISPYLDLLKSSASNVDVISVIGADGERKYHTNHELIGTVYDGTAPDFTGNREIYVTSDSGPSGNQRRAYEAIYDSDGKYLGFLITVILNKNINRIILRTIVIHLLCATAVIICAELLSLKLSKKIKDLLMGYEPDIFSAMYSVRENILDSLEEGIAAAGADGNIIYTNNAARIMLGEDTKHISKLLALNSTVKSGEKSEQISISTESGTEIIADKIPITEKGAITGALCILRDRTEYTRIMEELSGVRFMVESMRANSHDFINKLHVILGLIRMDRNQEACEYISNVTSIQQTMIHSIVKNIDDPTVAALLIGKYSRASELNIKFSLDSSSRLSRSDISILSGDLVTIIGNLLDNAMDSMNSKGTDEKELSFGIFTSPGAMLITVSDTGTGMDSNTLDHIFDSGFSTKGSGRGTGLYQVKKLIAKYSGTVSADSDAGIGTVFTVTLTDERSSGHV